MIVFSSFCHILHIRNLFFAISYDFFWFIIFSSFVNPFDTSLDLMMSQLVGILSFPIHLNSYLQLSLLEVPVLHLFKGSQTIFMIPALIYKMLLHSIYRE